MRELAASGAPCLVAIDDYGALHGPTGYGTTVTRLAPGHEAGPHNGGHAALWRRPLRVEELNLVRSSGGGFSLEGGV